MLLLPWESFIQEGNVLKSYFSKKHSGAMLTDQASPSLLCGGTDLYKTCIFVASGLNFHSCSKLHISSCCAMWELSGNPSSCALSVNLCSSNPRKTLSCNCCCAHPDCNRTDKTWFSDQAFLFVCSLSTFAWSEYWKSTEHEPSIYRYAVNSHTIMSKTKRCKLYHNMSSKPPTI